MNEEVSLEEVMRIYAELKELAPSYLYYQVSPSMPDKLDFDGEMKPGFILIKPEHTGLEADLLVVHPSWEDRLLRELGERLRPVTREDWTRANQRKLQQSSWESTKVLSQ